MTAQERLDGAMASTSNAKRGLLDELLGRPARLQAVARAIPGNDGKPEDQRLDAARRHLQVAFTTVNKNPALLKCSAQSIAAATAEAAQLGLVCDGVLGQAYLVPFRQQVQLQIGYRGYIALAYRTGQVERITADVIYPGDDFDYCEGSEPFLRHKRQLSAEGGDPLGAYAICHLKGARYPLFRVMPIAEILAHRARSPYWSATKKGPWETDFAAMAMKTPMRTLAKWMPQDILQAAAARDEQRELGLLRPTAEILGETDEGETDGGDTILQQPGA